MAIRKRRVLVPGIPQPAGMPPFFLAVDHELSMSMFRHLKEHLFDRLVIPKLHHSIVCAHGALAASVVQIHALTPGEATFQRLDKNQDGKITLDESPGPDGLLERLKQVLAAKMPFANDGRGVTLRLQQVRQRLLVGIQAVVFLGNSTPMLRREADWLCLSRKLGSPVCSSSGSDRRVWLTAMDVEPQRKASVQRRMCFMMVAGCFTAC